MTFKTQMAAVSVTYLSDRFLEHIHECIKENFSSHFLDKLNKFNYTFSSSRSCVGLKNNHILTLGKGFIVRASVSHLIL